MTFVPVAVIFFKQKWGRDCEPKGVDAEDLKAKIGVLINGS